MDFEEFYGIVSKDATLLESLSQFTVHPTWFIRSSSVPAEKNNKVQRFFMHCCQYQRMYEARKHKLTADYIKDNLSRIIMLMLYLLINVALAIYVIIYRVTVTKSHVLVVFARVGGMLLNFNCALIVALMLKQTILVIRTNRFLRKLIPVDDHIDFHKTVGRVIAALAIVHTIAHMANFGRLSGRSDVQREERGLKRVSMFRILVGHVHGRFASDGLEMRGNVLHFSSRQKRTSDGSAVSLLSAVLFSA